MTKLSLPLLGVAGVGGRHWAAQSDQEGPTGACPRGEACALQATLGPAGDMESPPEPWQRTGPPGGPRG